MLDSVRNLRTSEIELRQPLPALECEWLVGRLLAKRGVADAVCGRRPRRLLVEYDADELRSHDLVDYLSACGIRVAAVRAGRPIARG
jgi:hypothetical protein